MLMYHGEEGGEMSGLGDRVVYDPVGKEVIRMRGHRIIYLSPGHRLVRMKRQRHHPIPAVRASETVPYAAMPVSGEGDVFGIDVTKWSDAAMNPLSGHGAQMDFNQMMASQAKHRTPAWWPQAGMSNMDWKEMREDRPMWKGLSQAMDWKEMREDRPLWKGLSNMDYRQMQADRSMWKGLSAVEKKRKMARMAQAQAAAAPAPAPAMARKKRRHYDEADGGSIF